MRSFFLMIKIFQYKQETPTEFLTILIQLPPDKSGGYAKVTLTELK